MEVLWLKSQKIPHPKIGQLAGISPNALLTYLRDEQEGGVEKLTEINLYRPKSELESQRETLKKYLWKNPPATINEAVYSRVKASQTLLTIGQFSAPREHFK